LTVCRTASTSRAIRGKRRTVDRRVPCESHDRVLQVVQHPSLKCHRVGELSSKASLGSAFQIPAPPAAASICQDQLADQIERAVDFCRIHAQQVVGTGRYGGAAVRWARACSGPDACAISVLTRWQSARPRFGVENRHPRSRRGSRGSARVGACPRSDIVFTFSVMVEYCISRDLFRRFVRRESRCYLDDRFVTASPDREPAPRQPGKANWII